VVLSKRKSYFVAMQNSLKIVEKLSVIQWYHRYEYAINIIKKTGLSCLAFCVMVLNAGAQQQLADSLKQALQQLPDDTMKVNTLNALSQASYDLSDYDNELLYAQQALKLSQQLNWKKGIALSYKNIGSAYDDVGNFAEALVHYRKAIPIYQQINDKAGMAACHNNMGLVFRNQGNLTEALKHHFTSLKIKEEIGDTTSIAVSYNNIGNVFKAQGNYQSALSNHQKALALRTAIGNQRGIAASYGNIGNVYLELGWHEKALTNYFKALEIEEQTGNKKGTAIAFSNIGAAYFEQGNYHQALNYNQKALSIELEIGDITGAAGSYINLGNVLVRQNKAAQGKQFLQKALAIGLETGDMEIIKNSYDGLSQADSAIGDFRSSLMHFRKYITYRDSLLNAESNVKTMQMEMQYQYDKKETAAKLYQEKKDALALQEVQKQKLLRNSFIAGFILMFTLAGVSYRSYIRKRKDNRLIAQQKALVEQKNKEVTESLQYAQHIQQAVLPETNKLQQLLKECFVLYLPKDIVSGDFYSIISKGDKIVLAVADCTGHGVAGAFMSIIGTSLLQQIVNEKNVVLPDSILNQLNEGVIAALKQRDNILNDGMDICLITLDAKNDMLHYAGANRPLWVVRNNEVLVFNPDKLSVGGWHMKGNITYSCQCIVLKPNDAIYLFTDGYADQFGGDFGKKMMTKKFKQLLCDIHQQDMPRQKETLLKYFNSWKGIHDQVDDVLVIGFRV
jgi:tetratricopeptide (TPR) repeat protein